MKRRGVLERLSGVLALPAEAVAGTMLVELKGDMQLRVENHRGILAYDPGEIHVGGGRLTLRVRGEGMELKTMRRGELLITGRIFGIELE